MKGTGIESSPRPTYAIAGSTISAAIHAGLIVGTLLLQSHIASLPPEEPIPLNAQFLYPLLKPEPRPSVEQVSFVGLSSYQPSALPVQQRDESAAPKPPTEIPPPPRQVAAEEIPAPEPPKTFTEVEVDSAAVRDPSSAAPEYPPKLLAAKLEGSTLAQFVVDSTGHVEMKTLVILESTHPDFTQSIRDVLPRMKYQPARLGKRPVAQLVEQRFGFILQPPE